tara:strand:- start:690 stop:1565 length:876 start_codon:yes stop_codon:yes gene_type:complete
MTTWLDIEKRIDKLMNRRGLKNHKAADRFIIDFKAHLSREERLAPGGNAEKTLRLLEEDENLTPYTIFGNNFRKNISELISEPLMNDSIFPQLFDILVDNKGKGVGAGELVLPLIISHYEFKNSSDGKTPDGKTELKKSGASLKPIKKGVTREGLVDVLNDKYFKGTAPGYVDKKLFKKHIDTVTDPKVYGDYFEELYPSCDTIELFESVLTCYKDPVLFNEAVGKFALSNYQRVDGWNNIIIIDTEKKNVVVNIKDVNNIDELGLKFTPKFKRKKDTQAVADGYVNVTII